MITEADRALVRILSRIDRLFFSVNLGAYDDDDLGELRSLIDILTKNYSINIAEIAESSRKSTAVIRNIIGGGRPKLYSFLSVVSGMRYSVAFRLVDLGLLKSISLTECRGAIWVDYRKFSDIGSLLIAVDILERFRSEVQGSNFVMGGYDNASVSEIIELLEAIVAQLKSGIAERGLIVTLNRRLREFAVWAGGKFLGKGLEKLAESAVDWTGKF